MKIIVYASFDSDMMSDKGKESGLSETASDFFSCFQEMKVELEVEEETGKVINAKIIDTFK